MSPRHAAIEDLAAAIAMVAAPLLSPEVAPPARGLYLATGDAGIDVAVTFWAEALASSPRFANPASFPWTLANAPAGLIARALDLRGPCHTLVGGAEAMVAALAHADADLARGRVREAVVVGCDLAAEIQAAVVVRREPCGCLGVPDGSDTATAMLVRCGGRAIKIMSARA